MATNKNALIRYKTIDKCLQNRTRKWTLDDLIEACSNALYEFEGKHSYVSKRTIQLDIQLMRSNKLGYEAPIIVYDRKHYTYEDEMYTITNLPIDQLDMDILIESMDMLSQFKEFSLFRELNGVIQKLEDKIYRASNRESPIIHLDKNDNLKGLVHIDGLYQAILKKMVLDIDYKSFKARSNQNIIIHPCILKEYNNRWFLVGIQDESSKVMTLALDRINKINFNLKIDFNDHNFDADQYYKDTIGVTVLTDKQLLDVSLKFDQMNAPYVLTKPIHHSQKLLEQMKDGSIIISLKVHNNFEFQRLILGFGAGIEILKPRRLRSMIKKTLKIAVAQYDSTPSSI